MEADRFWRGARRALWAMAAAASLFVGRDADGQSLVFGEGILAQPLAVEQTPAFGTFWSTHPEFPPLPWNPYRDWALPVYDLGAGRYLVDDRTVDYDLLREQRIVDQSLRTLEAQYGLESQSLESPPVPPGWGGGGTNDPGPEVPAQPAYNFPTNSFFLEILGVTNGYAWVTLHGTVQDEMYEILSKQTLSDTVWLSETKILGVAEQTAVTVPVGERTNSLFLWARSWVDGDGNGLPEWWELQYFGHTGVDPYGDDDGDGWTNLQEWQNGTNPGLFESPPAPTGLKVAYFGTGSNTIVIWNPSPGPVVGYVVERYTPPNTTNTYASASTTLANLVSQVDPNFPPTFRVRAFYLGGSSAWSAAVSLFDPACSLEALSGGGVIYGTDWSLSVYDPATSANARVCRGAGGRLFLVTGRVPSGIAKVRVSASIRADLNPWYPVTFGANYLVEEPVRFTNAPSGTSFEIPATALQSGYCELPPWLVPPYGSYRLEVESVAENGCVVQCRPLDGFEQGIWEWSTGVVPFLDGRRQIKQNAEFQLRAAEGCSRWPLGDGWETNIVPFAVRQWNNFGGEAGSYSESASPEYVVAGFHHLQAVDGGGWGWAGSALTLDPFRPFEQNWFYANFLYAGPPWGTSGWNCGDIYCTPNAVPYVWSEQKYTVDNPAFRFSVNAFIQAGGTNPVSAVLSPSISEFQFLRQADRTFADWQRDWGHLWADYPNLYGLQLLSAISTPYAVFYDAPPSPTLLTSGSPIPPDDGIYFFNTARPQFTNMGYYFARAPIKWIFVPGPWGDPISVPDLPEPRPGEPDFSPAAASPLLIAPFGQPLFLNAWSREGLLNGYTDKFAFLEQYFDKAVLCDNNGNPTTNSAGILSPYGEFFPTMPGNVALLTMPDVDSTNQVGTGVLHVIKLQLDVDHDGVMDLSFGGPDNTSQRHPFAFWVNDDHDEPASGSKPDRDLPTPENLPDYTPREIRSQRTLEDFARLWICGVPSLPVGEGYDVTLTLNPVSGSPALNLYRAHETNGGIQYLTSTNVAASTVGSALTRFPILTIYSGADYSLPLSTFDGTDKYFLFEAAAPGAAELVLAVRRNNQPIARYSAWVDFRNIRDFYERVVITNITSGAKSNWVSVISRNEYPAIEDESETRDIIVFVHGFNNSEWNWYNNGETVFKRLYWSGYHGRFASVGWPCKYFGLDLMAFNESEFSSYKAGTAMGAYLTQLRNRFPGHRLHLLAHSQGNAIASEALSAGAPFDTYLLSQAALPGSSYDVNALTNPALTAYEIGNYITPDWQPMGYHGAYTNLTGRILNLYNPQDGVLAIWEINQKQFKPSFGYVFNGTSSTNLVGNYLVTDPQESRAMVARSRTLSIGQSGPASQHGVIQSAVDLHAEFDFSDTTAEHSAQWTRPIHTSRPYYLQILESIKP